MPESKQRHAQASRPLSNPKKNELVKVKVGAIDESKSAIATKDIKL